ncbi:MAG: IS110 family transposase [Planctomycetaceae bacterium]|nr:IS110 family transposase [Planctomycetaceae bacterium]MBV8318897.1 IS110 family transposase [Planctomycetaceae bacterium]MBV8678358.1 IS110 family transposase [Planctomycetaceae bacterium]
MNYVGIDLHKKTIVLCVMDQHRAVRHRGSFACGDTEAILAFVRRLGPFRAVVEATASYEWLVELIEPLAEKVVLANPKKLRVIAESTKKTDKLDAQVLAEFLARDMIPEAYRPSPRQREHRTLVRHRQYLRQRATALKVKMRRIVSDYNADRRDLFTAAGWQAALQGIKLRDGDRFVLDQLHAQWQGLEDQVRELKRRLQTFAAAAPPREAEARAKLETIPGVGPVTINVVLSELGSDVRRFASAKAVTAYAGLAPRVRQSAGKGKDLGITKEGSPLLRWALVEASWRVVHHSASWRRIYESIKKRAGGKKAIVAVARRLLCVIYAMLRDGTNYDLLRVGEPQPS